MAAMASDTASVYTQDTGYGRSEKSLEKYYTRPEVAQKVFDIFLQTIEHYLGLECYVIEDNSVFRGTIVEVDDDYFLVENMYGTKEWVSREDVTLLS